MTVEFIHGVSSLPGWDFGENFGGWLTELDGRTFLIDCGVGTGAEDMARNLSRSLNGRKLDYILLTHIHLDHAGGLGRLLTQWPEAKVVVHAQGVRHLVSPARLWAGTREVMGEVAEVYGQPRPLPESTFIPHLQADIPGLKIFETPGHAPHHLSFLLGETMFVGEAVGSPKYYQGRFYMRPATPPQFFPEETLASIELLAREPERTAYLAHADAPVPYHQAIELCRKQLSLWDEILRRPGSLKLEGEDRKVWLERLVDVIVAEDPYYLPLGEMVSADPRWAKWERNMIVNCIEGFLGHYDRLRRAGAGGD